MDCSRILLVVTFMSITILVSSLTQSAFASNTSSPGCPNCSDTNKRQQNQTTSAGTLQVGFSTDPINPNTSGQTQIKLNFLTKQNTLQNHIDYKISIIQDSNQVFGIPITHTAEGSVSIPFQFQTVGTYQIIVEVDGILFQPIPPETATFSISAAGSQNQTPPTEPVPPASTGNIVIPKWVKNNAMYWSQGQLENPDFIKGIQYLIQQGIMQIPKTTPGTGSSQIIPGWIKNNAGYWATGDIDDATFVKGIQYLITNGIMTLS
jgi:hypothetical protein